MRNAFAAAVIGLVGLSGLAVVNAGEKPPAAFVKAMKTLNAAVQGMAKASSSGIYTDVKTDAAAARDALDVVVQFWDTKKNASAMDFAKEAIKATSDLETAAGEESREGVEFALKQIQGNCAACHAAHREALPDGTFEIK
jgi:hypothetical protein